MFVLAHWEDVRNVWIIAAGMFAVLLVLNPLHEYPVIDDWIYTRSVQDQVATGAFHMPDRSQANLVGLTLWGTLWVRLFGFSFSILTASTLVLAFICIIAFYFLARALDVTSGGALLGAGLLGFNPLFLHLSYSFMSDVPFLALTVLSLLLYVLGVRRGNPWCLLLGGLATGYAYLIRQFGILPPMGFLAYLALDGLVARRWRWRDMVLVALPPALIAVGWYMLSRDFPPNSASQEAARLASDFVGKPQWIGVFLNRALTVLPLTAFFAWTAVRMSRRRLVLTAAWSAVFVWATLAISIPQETYTFVGYGNIVRTGGIDFFEYKQEPIWTPEIWKGLALLGALLAGLALGAMTDSLLTWLAGLRRREELSPAVGVYLTGAATFVVSLGLLGHFFDRYALLFYPFAVLFMIRDSGRWTRPAWAYSAVALGLLATFTLLAQADFADHDNARWDAGKWLSARAPQTIHVGYDWDNWVAFPGGQYEITDLPNPGWGTDRIFPYFSRLSGFTTRYLLAQSAPGAPLLTPLPPP